jgi:hypothetical protein
MSNVKITFELPEELVERAKAVGLQIDDQTESFIALLEDEIERREAGQRLLEIADKLRALPDEMKPTTDEIDETVKSYWAEN